VDRLQIACEAGNNSVSGFSRNVGLLAAARQDQAPTSAAREI